MTTHELLETYSDSIIQIITPTGTGTGFFLEEYDLIVTNSHVVDGNKEVVINTSKKKKVISKVVYDDPRHDLAFVKTTVKLSNKLPLKLAQKEVDNGDKVIALGHPYGLKYSATEGIVSRAKRMEENIEYIQIDAAINPGNSGGPSFNKDGQVVGVNTFIIRDSNNLGFALPVSYVKDALDGYLKVKKENIIRCPSCLAFNLEETIEKSYCPNCGKKIKVAKKREEGYTPSEPTVELIEDIITEIGKDIKISRMGYKRWEIEEGSAKINIAYYDNGVIESDTYLCRLPKDNLKEIYTYMLKENAKLDYLTFSIHDNKVLLSYIIINSSLTKEVGGVALKRLVEKADFYDDYMIDNFGAIKIEEE
ncbi:MAG: Serine protease precursor MucD/AlgY associated with sigma factor RpoE [uncultured Campylobacterales bacterium]|uniref:Serine protease MucD/AlgY associated with sigma factor RpoE n=1 Tax=uncultured Campylobacterales bacterium TaxID=352960 RepID=A0A6S6SBI7_9BACT|nr:MAG: Serine protease precursor MucD/AlgY associated with sigma factor RpoE [uncultured Campylobacterales bacterium]